MSVIREQALRMRSMQVVRALSSAFDRGEMPSDEELAPFYELVEEGADAEPAATEEFAASLRDLREIAVARNWPEMVEQVNGLLGRLEPQVRRDRKRRRDGEAVEQARKKGGPKPLAGVELAVRERIAKFERKGEPWTAKDVWQSLGERGWEGERDGWALSVERRGNELVQCSTRGSAQHEQAIVFPTFLRYLTAARRKKISVRST